jgi:hypothetical protein
MRHIISSGSVSDTHNVTGSNVLSLTASILRLAKSLDSPTRSVIASSIVQAIP